MKNCLVNVYIFDIFFYKGEEIMDDNTTIKQGGYFVIGIGVIVFLLGLVAYIFY
jgi:hypothetical protein